MNLCTIHEYNLRGSFEELENVEKERKKSSSFKFNRVWTIPVSFENAR